MKTSSETLAYGLIVLGEGFRASAIRGVMTAISSLSAASIHAWFATSKQASRGASSSSGPAS